MLTKKEIRRQFAALGYKASFKQHKLIDNAVKLYVMREDQRVVGDFNAMSKERYEKYKDGIMLANSFRNQILDSGEKII